MDRLRGAALASVVTFCGWRQCSDLSSFVGVAVLLKLQRRASSEAQQLGAVTFLSAIVALVIRH